jgi:hypothetical protein
METLHSTSPRKSTTRPLAHRAPTSRRRRAPIVGSRVAGHLSHWEDDFDRIYFGPTSDFGKLHDSSWFRMRACGGSCRADAWRVSTTLCGRRVYLDALIDDFGNLVAIDE